MDPEMNNIFFDEHVNGPRTQPPLPDCGFRQHFFLSSAATALEIGARPYWVGMRRCFTDPSHSKALALGIAGKPTAIFMGHSAAIRPAFASPVLVRRMESRLIRKAA
jgi:hypothetical protein